MLNLRPSQNYLKLAPPTQQEEFFGTPYGAIWRPEPETSMVVGEVLKYGEGVTQPIYVGDVVLYNSFAGIEFEGAVYVEEKDVVAYGRPSEEE